MGYFSELDVAISEAVEIHFPDVTPTAVRVPQGNFEGGEAPSDLNAQYFTVVLKAGPVEVEIDRRWHLDSAIELEDMINEHLAA